MVLSINFKMSAFKYSPLLLLQLILLILFFAFVRYGETKTTSGFEGTHVMIFIGFGFLMTFLKKYSYSAVGFNLLLASLVVQWAMLCQNFYHMKGGVIFVNKFSMIEADIMSATVLITMGALLGVASGLQLIFISIVETAVACANLYVIVDVFKAADAGGSMGIHAFGAYFGLGCSLGMRKRTTSPENPQSPETPQSPVVKLDEPTYTSDVFAMLGSIFLWIYWPSFNAALVGTPGEYERAVMNTYLSLAAATVTTFYFSSLLSHHKGKFDMVHIQNATLAGGVAVGSVCNMHVSPGGAIALGTGAAILSVLGYRFLTPFLTKLGINDTCGVNNLHGMPGLYSGLFSILFAALATEDVYGKELSSVFPAMEELEGLTPRTAKGQALHQLMALAVTLVLAFFSGLITGLIAKFVMPLKEEDRYDDTIDWEVPA